MKTGLFEQILEVLPNTLTFDLIDGTTMGLSHASGTQVDLCLNGDRVDLYLSRDMENNPAFSELVGEAPAEPHAILQAIETLASKFDAILREIDRKSS